MRAVTISDWGGTPSITDVPQPTTGENEVLIDIEACGVGRTVQNVIDGNMKDEQELLPKIPGHEIVGRVTQTGPGVDHLTSGDRVTAFFHIVCDSCQYCESGRPTLCENHSGWISVDTDGGLAEQAILPAGNAIPIDGDIDPVDATVIPDAVATPVHVARQTARIEPGDRVAVLGAGGGVGIHMLQVADYFGAEVTAVDVVGEKLDHCRNLGASATLDPTTEALDSREPFDSIIDFVGDTALLSTAAEALGPRGRLVNLTTFPENTMALSPRTEVLNEIAVVGSKYCAKHELRQAAEFVAEGVIQPVVGEEASLSEAPALLNRVVENEIIGRGAVRIEK